MADEDTLWMLIVGSLVLIGLVLAAAIAIPLLILFLLWKLGEWIFNFILPLLERNERIYQPTKWDLERLAARESSRVIPTPPIQAIQTTEPKVYHVEKEPVAKQEVDETEEKEYEEIIYHQKIFVERELFHGQKEQLIAQGYKRLKTSPYGDTGAFYYWVKTQYNESSEHAFFCYMIEGELRKHTKEVDLYVNNGPDVVLRYRKKVYCFDVETGKNLVRKPEQTKKKFLGYKEDYYRSYIFVTRKSLKHRYGRWGKVITRSTFRKIISKIFS